MTKFKSILIAGTVMPGLLLSQSAVGVAQTAPGPMRLAQAPADQEHQHKGPAGPGGAPHQGAPGGQPHHEGPGGAPHAGAPAAPQHQAPAAQPHPQQAPVAPQRHEAPAAQPHPAAPNAPQRHEAPATAPTNHSAPAHQTPPAQHAPASPGGFGAPAQHQPVQQNQNPGGFGAPQGRPAPGQPNRAGAGGPEQHGRPQQGQPAQGQPSHGEPPHGQPQQGQPQPGQARPGQPPQGQQQGERRGGGVGPGGAAAIGAAAGFAGGFLAATGAHGIEDIRRDRHEVTEGGVDYIREPGRTIVREGDHAFIVHDENERFRELGLGIHTERHGNELVSIIDRPGGEQILTYTDPDGRMLRRVRRLRDGREIVLIDNGYDGRVRDYRDDVVVLPEEPLRIPRDRFIVEADGADEGLIYDTLIAPPVAPVPQRYTLDQIRYSPTLRMRMRSVDIDTLNFDTGSWIVPQDQARKLELIGDAIKKAVARNANEVFLVEGYTDATGNPTDNLSLSDRRAQSVATILTRDFGVPPENLTTQGYGQQYLKEQTQGSSRVNRRVTVRRITPLLAAGGAGAQ